jgi:hypothetical protein
MIANTIEPSKEFVNKKLLTFKLYQMDVHFEGYSMSFTMVGEDKYIFPIIGFIPC